MEHQPDRRTFLKTSMALAVSGSVGADDLVNSNGLVDVRHKTYTMDEINADPEGLCKYKDAFKEAWAVLRTPEPLNFPDWADKNYFLAPTSSGIPGPWTTYAYQRGMMLLMSHDGVRKVVLQKPARVGYTKILSAYTVYRLERSKRNVAIWQPTNDAAKEYVQDEINPLFDYVPVFRDACVADLKNPKDPLNTNSRKEFIGSTLHVNGGKSADNYRRITVDDVILDELDAFDANIRGTSGKMEGSAVDLATVRNTDSPYKKTILGSTPTERGLSQIESELALCEEVLEWHVHCPHCDHAQQLMWGGADTDHGVKWDGDDNKSARYQCANPACTEDHNPEKRKSFLWRDMLTQSTKSGYWASDRIRLDHTGDEAKFYYLAPNEDGTERAAPVPEDIGFKFNTLLSPFFAWSEMVKDFKRAAKEMEVGDRSKMRTFVNTRLGETFEEFVTEKVDPQFYMTRLEEYPRVTIDGQHACDIPLAVNALTVAVDVHIDRFELEFKGWAAGEEQYGIHVERIFGNTSVIPAYDDEGVKIPGQPETVWCKLDKALRRRFRHESGSLMGASVAFIDSGYQTHEVYQFCRRDNTFFIPVKGSGAGLSHPLIKVPNKPTTDRVFLTHIGSDNCLDMLYARYDIDGENEDPSAQAYAKCHWPADRPNEYNLQYFTQMVAEQRIRVVRQGRAVMAWICPPNQSNEISDLNKYNLAAIKFCQLYKGVNLGLQETHEGPEETDDITEVLAQMREMAIAREQKMAYG